MEKSKKQKEHSKEMYDLGYKQAVEEIITLIIEKFGDLIQANQLIKKLKEKFT